MTDRPPAGDAEMERAIRSWQENPPRRSHHQRQQVARREVERLNRERRRVSRPWHHHPAARIAFILGALVVAGIVAYVFVDGVTAVTGGNP